jgi:NitT/TauT family transport system substrate-binding protein
MVVRKLTRAILVLAALVLPAATAAADDTLKVSIGQMDTWVNQAAVLGQRVGIFQKHGITLENFATQGSGETLQAVISDAAQVGIGVGTLGVLRAYARGAPIRIIGASFTGVGDLYWYVRADSPITKLADATASNTIAFSSNGSSVHNVVLAFIQDLGLKAKPTQTGGLATTLTQVMSGQIDIGWATPPFGLKEAEEGKVRIIANGNDVASLRDQTVRVEIVNAATWKSHDLMRRFMRGYRESLDWIFADPRAIKLYSEATGVSEALVRSSIDRFGLKSAKQLDRISGIDAIMTEGVKFKFLDQPLSKEQLADLIQILPDGS